MEGDWVLFQLINGWAGRWPLLDGIMRPLVNDYMLTTAMSLGLVALWFACPVAPHTGTVRHREGKGQAERERNQRAVLMAILSLLAANLLLKLCNIIYFRPRPFHAHPVNLLFYHPTDSSLPSNIATMGFALAVSVWIGNRKAGLGFILAALLLGFARVFCGVHYPGDVLAGALLGGGVAYALSRQGRWLDLLLDFVLRVARAMYLA
ncbi:MAG: phosphatase PAP2 family protein [Chloroflexota bacterium]|nr:phosphatase PAP2 family protein [Chloroflexota bacterium]